VPPRPSNGNLEGKTQADKRLQGRAANLSTRRGGKKNQKVSSQRWSKREDSEVRSTGEELREGERGLLEFEDAAKGESQRGQSLGMWERKTGTQKEGE